MGRKRIVAGALVAVSALATVGIVGCGSPAGQPPSANPSAPSAASTRLTSAAGGAVQFTDYTDDDGAVATAIVTGAIGDLGTAISIHPDGTLNQDHDGQLDVALSQGTFRLDIAALDKKVVGLLGAGPFNNSTCSGTVSTSAPVPIVAGSGTGAYRGISGSFTLTTTIAEVDAKPKCNAVGYFLSQSIVTAGSGTVSFS